ncbi:hypothetical protein M406DRAFT_68632 [Cryphonectria parasitica EP155]|uniref:Uncharacterized protein n=1 Tax=Cryphonectria parasitica (strain ATCC 38755 / EP155) TaxID=660469 RepID=A0A9P4Y4F0_CRYP1|nr:uncharacterized protein M406DRAFT_68632 [Cryphonectria parasitica EP155]KAF3766274.1 hypothetical protein M406DRAFT_68632 [Cryphonectria parasitica EP155]
MVFNIIAPIAAGVLADTAKAISPAVLDLDKSLNNSMTGGLATNITHVICRNPGFGWSPTEMLADGITYLNDKDGYTEFGWKVGGGCCTRVSCEKDSGIYVCNDNCWIATIRAVIPSHTSSL